MVRALVLYGALAYTIYTKNALSEIRPPTTPRLTSTAGAGVGSVLLEEATILNPSSIAFFKTTLLSYQQTHVKGGGRSYALTGADTKSAIKGAIRFDKGREGSTSRQVLNLTTGYAFGGKSGVGLGVDFVNTKGGLKNKGQKEYRDIRIGATHVISSRFSAGAVIEDPFKQSPLRDRILVGAQYLFGNYVALMADFGVDYRAPNLNQKAASYQLALQIQFLSSCFLRGGISQGKARQSDQDEKKVGLGASWVQPKLTLDGAFQDVEVESAPPFREMAFSISYRF